MTDKVVLFVWGVKCLLFEERSNTFFKPWEDGGYTFFFFFFTADWNFFMVSQTIVHCRTASDGLFLSPHCRIGTLCWKENTDAAQMISPDDPRIEDLTVLSTVTMRTSFFFNFSGYWQCKDNKKRQQQPLWEIHRDRFWQSLSHHWCQHENISSREITSCVSGKFIWLFAALISSIS